MRYLLDTDVLSEVRKPRGAANVKRWISSVPAEETDPPVVPVRQDDLAAGYLLPDDVAVDMVVFPGQIVEVIQAREGYTQTDRTISPASSGQERKQGNS